MRFVILLVVAALVIPQGKEERSVEDELAALIEKTNALESFHLVYDMGNAGEEGPAKATFEFVYRAPDLARMRATSDKGEMDMWINEDQMTWRTDIEEQGDGAWHRASFPDPLPASLVLDELFPGDESPLGPGVFLRMTIRDDPDTGKAAFHVSFGQARQGRTFVLGWLDNLRRRSDELSTEGQSFVLAGEHFRFRVSRSNGMLEQVEADSDEGPVEFKLRECHLDEPLEEQLIELPEEAKAAALDPEMTRGFEGLFGPGSLRHEAFLRVEGQLDTDKRPWNELTRNDWRTFLDALHRGMITKQQSDWIEQLREYVDKKAEWVRSQRAENDSPERLAELETEVAKDRAKLEENFESAQSKYVDDLPAVESKRNEPRQELFDIEGQVIADLWDELLREPILASYDEKLAEALER